MTFREAYAEERAAYQRVIRWRALYSRCRPRMEQMSPAAAFRLHYQLKDAELDAIAEHEAAERRLYATGDVIISRMLAA